MMTNPRWFGLGVALMQFQAQTTVGRDNKRMVRPLLKQFSRIPDRGHDNPAAAARLVVSQGPMANDEDTPDGFFRPANN